MKVSPYDFKKQPRDLVDFKDDVTYILNYGKYAAQIVTVQPWWIAREGEHCYRFAASSGGGTDYYAYYWINSGWVWIKWSGSGGAVTSKIYDADEDTIVDTEQNSDEDIIRMTAFNFEIVTVNSEQMAVTTNRKLGLKGLNGTSYFRYNSGNGYSEVYVDGDLRVEM